MTITDPHDDFRRRLLRAGMGAASLFFLELTSSESFHGCPCSALTTDVFALYVAWCRRLRLRPGAVPRFARDLAREHGVPLKRLRYTIAGKQHGPHGVLVLSGSTVRLGAQIEHFRAVANCMAGGMIA